MVRIEEKIEKFFINIITIKQSTMASVAHKTVSSMSSMLSKNITKHYGGGKTLIDDSKHSDKELIGVVKDVILPYCQSVFDKMKPGYKVVFQKKITTFECLNIFKRFVQNDVLFPEMNEDMIKSYKKSYMSPDGGILFVESPTGKKYPILISEDKIQGTNDSRKASGKKKQSTGNAIERAGKNMNLSKTLCGGLSYFPYVLFGAGCDFYHTETISMRLVQMNYLFPNKYIDFHKTTESIETQLEKLIETIDISKKMNLEVATICLKAHHWEKSEHGVSNWTYNERVAICRKVVDQSIEHIMKYE